jgi:two-component sensor histidine kinase
MVRYTKLPLEFPNMPNAIQSIPGAPSTFLGYDFSTLGRRPQRLSTWQRLSDGIRSALRVDLREVTNLRLIEAKKDQLLKETVDLLHHKEILLQELQHRVVNSLQIIASILALKMRGVTCEETRQELQDARQRIVSIAELQRRFCVVEGNDQIIIGSYLTELCASLATSMIGAGQPIAIKVLATEGTMKSNSALSIGLIVTELLINAIKYAFPTSKPGGLVLVTYEVDGSDWKLIVSDNGIGKSDAVGTHVGLGSIIIAALVQQLGAKLEITGGSSGTSVSITQATFTSH